MNDNSVDNYSIDTYTQDWLVEQTHEAAPYYDATEIYDLFIALHYMT